MAPLYHLAQLNIARLAAPLDSPQLAGFVALLDQINALADGSPGFVWRLQSGEGNATALRPFDDDLVLVNMSLWASLDDLQAYVYRTAHGAAMRRRREWFEPMRSAYVVLWWVPAGHIPSLGEARERLEQLQAHGPSELAFTFKHAFPRPGERA